MFVIEAEAYPQEGVGLPDYASPKPVGQVPVGSVYTLTDLAELAVRLGSINTFDRRGNVIWSDDFEGGIEKWGYFTSFPKPEWLHKGHKGGGFCIEVARDAGIGNMQYIYHSFPYPVLSKMGVEFSFTLQTYLANIQFDFDLYDEENLNAARVKYEPASNLLSIAVNPFPTWQPLSPIIDLPVVEEEIYHTIKLVADFTTGRYERLIVNGVLYDISDYEYWRDSSPGSPEAGVVAAIENNSGTEQCKTYIDGVIVTQNEPSNV